MGYRERERDHYRGPLMLGSMRSSAALSEISLLSHKHTYIRKHIHTLQRLAISCYIVKIRGSPYVPYLGKILKQTIAHSRNSVSWTSIPHRPVRVIVPCSSSAALKLRVHCCIQGYPVKSNHPSRTTGPHSVRRRGAYSVCISWFLLAVQYTPADTGTQPSREQGLTTQCHNCFLFNRTQ